MKLELKSQIIISDNFDNIIKLLKEEASKEVYFEFFIKDDNSNFTLNDANEVIAKAYLASKEKVYLVLGAKQFSDVVQNRLLKIIEEPPPKKEFILLCKNQTTLLATITSRLPIERIFFEEKEEIELSLNVENLNLESIYHFLQEHKRVDANQAGKILEEIIKKAIKSQKFLLDEKALNFFGKLRQLLFLGGKGDFILNAALLMLLQKKKKVQNGYL